MSASTSFVQSRHETLVDGLLGTVRAHVWLIAPIEAYILFAYGLAMFLGKPGSFSFLGYAPTLAVAAPILCGAFLVARMSYVTLFIRPRRLVRFIIDDLRCNYLTRERLLHGLPVVLLLPLFSSAGTLLKTLMPMIHPYDWDPTLTAWDSTLHFGMAPWRILQPVLGHPLMTIGANDVYCFWFFGLTGMWFWQAFALRDRSLRKQFFLSYILCFVLLGNLAAICLASVGPCFYGRMFAGPDPYAPLMQYLQHMHGAASISVSLQDMLWRYHVSSGIGIGAGISAMPSMHVAGATLFALLGWRTNRVLGIALTVNVVLVEIATVCLGWHYAIDGYVAMLGTLVIWWAVGAVVRRTAPEVHSRAGKCSETGLPISSHA